jgi:hypothetical protein
VAAEQYTFGLTPGGSRTIHIWLIPDGSRTIHIKHKQHKEYGEQKIHNNQKLKPN